MHLSSFILRLLAPAVLPALSFIVLLVLMLAWQLFR